MWPGGVVFRPVKVLGLTVSMLVAYGLLAVCVRTFMHYSAATASCSLFGFCLLLRQETENLRRHRPEGSTPLCMFHADIM